MTKCNELPAHPTNVSTQAKPDSWLTRWGGAGRKLLAKGALLGIALVSTTAWAAPDFNIPAYNYDNQPTPLATNTPTTFRVTVGSSGDAPTTPLKVSINVPAGVAVEPGSFPSYCVLTGTPAASPNTAGTQVLQCTLPGGAIGIAGTSEEIAYVGRALVPNNSAYPMSACVDDNFTNAACDPYPADSDITNDSNGTNVLINAANDLGIAFDPVGLESVTTGAPYTFTARVSTNGLDVIPAGQVQAEFNLQPGFQNASAAAINTASPGWNCSVFGSKVSCVLTAAVPSNPTGVTQSLPDIKIPGTVTAAAGTVSIDGAVSSNDITAAVADPKPANNGPIVKTLNVAPGGNAKAEKSFLGQVGTATAAITGTTTVRIGATLDAGGAPLPAGATIMDDFSGMIAKGFVVGTPPAGCVFATPLVTCTTSVPLNPGGSVFFNIPLTNPTGPALPSPATGINEAVVTPPAGYTDSNPADNTKALPYLVLPPYADLEIIPVVGARKVPLGGTITRGVVVQNNGPLAVNYGGTNPPLRAYGNIAVQENGGTGVPVCPASVPLPWGTCAVSGTQLLFTTGPSVGTLPAGASTPPVTFTSIAPTAVSAIGTGPSTEVCTGQEILDKLVIAPSAGAQPPERTGAGGTFGPANEYANDCKDSRGIEYINPLAAAGDLQITKTVATLTAGQACDTTTSGFAAVQTLASVASNDNALCFRMDVKNEDPNRAGVIWGAAGIYTHGPAADYFITDTLPMYWGITSASENLPSPQSFNLVPAATTGESCALTGANINCTLKNLAANATRTLYVRIARGMLDGTHINTATTDSKNLLEPDDVPGSTGFAVNTATATSIINPVVDLQVSGKALNPNPIPVGKLGQYVFTYRNLGPNPSQQARVDDVIDTTRWEIVGTPVNTRGETCSLLVGAPSAGRTTVRCDLNTTPFERDQEFQVVIQVRPRFPYAQPNSSADGFSDGVGSPGYVNPGPSLPLNVAVNGMPGYTNTAQITTTRVIEAERSLTNNNSAVLVKVAPPRFDLIVAKTDVGSGLFGDNLSFANQVSYRVTLVNSGESKITGVHMVDLKPVLTSGNVPNFGTTTAVTNNAVVRTLNLVNAEFENSGLSGRTAPPVGIGAANTCVNDTPSLGMIRCEMSQVAAERFMLPGESISWKLTFDITPNTPAIRGNIVLPNRARGASNEAPFDMTVAGNVDYDKDQVRNATENTTWFAPMDLEISQKQTITPSPVNLNQTVQFNITFHNNGPSPTRRVRIIENLPPGFTFESAAFVIPAGSSLTPNAAAYPVSCSGATTVVCDIGDANSLVADFVPNGSSASGQLQVIAKVTNWVAVQAAGFNPGNLTNTASIEPGLDPANDKPLGKDSNSANNNGTSTVSVLKTSLSGKVCQVTQGANQADAATKNCTGPNPIVGTTIKICGVDAFSNTIGGGTPAANADCASPVTGLTNVSGDWEILIPPGNYTIVETQPSGFSDYTEQAGTGGGTIATGPQTTATNSGLNFGSQPEENKINVVAVPAAGTDSQRNPTGYNFTEIVNTGLSGFVYEDLNNNGQKDGSEPAIQGVTVRLTGTDFDGNVLDITAITDNNGLYQFSVPPSNPAGYTLTQSQPAGYYDGKEHKGNAAGTQAVSNVVANSEANNSAQGSSTGGSPVATGTTNTATDIITNVVLIESQGQTQHNFGEIRPGTITGVVYVDSNGSVTKQGAEATLPSVTVTLSGTDFLGNPVSATALTNSGGTYTFANLLPGDYSVTVAPVPGYTHTGSSVEGPNTVGATYAPRTSDTPSITTAAGVAAGGVIAPAVSTIKLGPGGISQGNNFGERGSDISGRVCEDYNNDGICQPGEPGISGVSITLSGTDAGGNLVTRTVVTSGTGLWVINNVPSPNPTGYTLEEVQPNGFLDGRQTLGSLTPYAGGATTTPGSTTPTDVATPLLRDRMTGIVFTTAGQGVNYDFAEVRPASLQGFVYQDVNQNGVRDVGTEPGITGVTIELTGTDDVNQVVSLTTTLTVSPDGSYSFANLRPGTYQVREIQPTPSTLFDGTVTVGSVSYALSGSPTSVVGTVITEASSTVSGSGEGVQAIVLGSGASGAGYNFGEVPRLSISGRVILDADAGGTLTGLETGIPNVTTTVTLCRANENPCLLGNTVASTVTNATTGNYQFNDVLPGSYFVIESQPLGYASSTDNSVPVTLTSTSVTDRNFFETAAQISGTVYTDNDASGAFSAPDTGIVGASLRLCLTSQLASCTSTNAVATTTTIASGSYTFANVPAPPPGDSYVIVEDESLPPLNTIANGTATVGTLVGDPSPVNGIIVTSQQGPAFAGNSTIGTISFVMPTAVATGVSVVGSGYNFGERPEAGISGLVFVDRNFTNGSTGTFDASTDTPLGTVTITLCSTDPGVGVCPALNVVSTTTAASNGAYSFPSVPAGNYWVIESQPAGYGSSSPNVQPVTRSGTVPVANVNFANTLASLSGRVYQDNDASGAFNGVDVGIGGVQVQLCRTSDTTCSAPIQTTTTSPSSGGTYTFVDVRAPGTDTYYIKEGLIPANLANATTTVGTLATAPGGTPTPGMANSPVSQITGITWIPSITAQSTPSATGLEYNFGELPLTSISGAVILDRNFDAQNNGTDSGLPSTTTITLCRTNTNPCDSTVTSTVTTPGSGTYTFPAVTPGNYFVIETQPAGYASSSPNSTAVSVVGGTPVSNVNFYETGARLSGIVYWDTNFSGAFNAGDVPLANVPVRLCTDATCSTVVATATTTVAGAYQFNDIPAPLPGQSYVIVEPSSINTGTTTLGDGTTTVGSVSLAGAGGTSNVGTANSIASRIEGVTWTPPTSVVTGTPAVVGTNFNFGEIEGFDVTGRVYYDRNRNGISDEAAGNGLNAVPITLCRANQNPCLATNIVATTTTALDGNYTFVKVPPGSYFMIETQPAGYGSTPTISSPSATDARPFAVSNAPLTGIDFADTLSGLAGLVYLDNNGDQALSPTDTTRLGGITITLTGIDASGASVTRTTVTAADGTYRFDDLRTGTYVVTETQPAIYGNGASHPGSTGGTGASNTNVITAIQLPPNTDSANNNFGDVPKTGAVSGSLWRDNDHDKVKDAGEPPLVGWTVELYRTPIGGGTPTLVTSVVTSGTGFYSIDGQEVGPGYSIRFVAPGPDGAVFGGAVNGETGTPIPGGSEVVRGELTNLTLQPNTTIPQQSLPVDPAGVVYDSDTRLPVPGAQVTFAPIGSCPAFDPAIHLVGGAGNATQTVGADGFYQFLLNPGAPACQYGITVTPPAGYVPDPDVPPQATPLTPPNRPPNDPFLIVPNPGAPQLPDPTTWFQSFNLGPNSRDIVNNHVPLVSSNRPVLFISKLAAKTTVELGDNVKYTVKVKYVKGNAPLPVLRVVDSMPAGFKLIPGTSFVSVPTGAAPVAVPAGNILGAPGAVVTYNIPLPGGAFNVGQEMELTYRVRVGVGSLQGDGINRAQANSTGAIRSNVAQAKVKVNPGVFTSDACIVGKIYVDCNNNHIQDAEEVGVPGVRLYLNDGTYMVSDSEGKYSICGLEPKSHVLKVDQITLPRGSRLTTTSNRNLGNADSLWLDLKNGEMQQADFAIGSCSNTVLEQVKARRSQGGVRSIDNERQGGTSLKFEGKNATYPDQGTDSANQPLVKPRPPGAPPPQSDAENNIPVPQLPAASSNTQGNNIRQTK
jgi:uncharacterized repeat protein (TIGR01451 family)